LERIDVLELINQAEYNGLDDFLMQNPFSIAFAKGTGKGTGKKGTGKKGTGKKGTGKCGTGSKRR